MLSPDQANDQQNEQQENENAHDAYEPAGLTDVSDRTWNDTASIAVQKWLYG